MISDECTANALSAGTPPVSTATGPLLPDPQTYAIHDALLSGEHEREGTGSGQDAKGPDVSPILSKGLVDVYTSWRLARYVC